MTTRRHLATLEKTLRALADETRMRIVGILAHGEVCVCHIHESLELPQPKVSRHLAFLRRAGVVEARKQGLWVFYRLDPAWLAAQGPLATAVLGRLETDGTCRADSQRLRRRPRTCEPDSAAAR